MAAERNKVRLDEFTSKVVPDPKNPGEVLLITGFLGASSEAEHTRIYWDASLSTYVDAKTTDIVHSEPLSKEQSPLGGSYLWVKRDAQVYFGAGGQSAKGKFFEGPLMTAYGGQFGAGGGAAAFAPATIGPTGAYCHVTALCPPNTLLCTPSPYHPCVSGYCTRSIVECPQSVAIACASLAACTLVCPVQTALCITIVCPVASPGCPPVGPGTPVQAQAGGMAAAKFPPFPHTELCNIPTMKACTHQADCYSQGCFPTYELNCQYAVKAGTGAAAAPAFQIPGIGGNPSLVCSYAAGCWFSFDACPTVFGYACGGGGGGRSVRFCPTY